MQVTAQCSINKLLAVTDLIKSRGIEVFVHTCKMGGWNYGTLCTRHKNCFEFIQFDCVQNSRLGHLFLTRVRS